MKVLVERQHGMGDILTATPIVRSLSKQYNTKIHVCTSWKYGSLLSYNPYVANVMIEPFNRDQFDKIYDLQTIKDIKYITECPRPLEWAEKIGVEIDNCHLDYYVSDKEKEWAHNQFVGQKKPLIGFIWASTGAHRSLSQIESNGIINRLIREGCGVAVFHNFKNMNLPHEVYDACGKYSLRRVIALINECDVLITPDTGLFHAASALNKKILLYAGSFPAEKLITSKNVTVINDPSGCPFYPCYAHTCVVKKDGNNPCLKIDVDKIVGEIKK